MKHTSFLSPSILTGLIPISGSQYLAVQYLAVQYLAVQIPKS